MSTDRELDKVKREADGRWLTPPKGGRNHGPSRAERIAMWLDGSGALPEGPIGEVLQKNLELARMGDPSATKALLERYAPLARADDERVKVPGFANAPSLEAKSAAVMHAIANGEISAAAGQRLLQALETHVRVVTANEVEQRLAALERAPAGARPKAVIDGKTGEVVGDDFEELA